MSLNIVYVGWLIYKYKGFGINYDVNWEYLIFCKKK